MSPRDRSPVRTSSPRHPSGKTTGNRWTTSQSDSAAVGTNYWCVWPEGNWPPDWAWFSPKVFSPFCHRWSFGSLPTVASGMLVGDTSFPAQSSTWLHRYYLNWTWAGHAITNSIMKCIQLIWVLILSFYIIDTISYFDIVQLLCYNCIVKSAI